MPWTSLCATGDLKEGQGHAVDVGGHRLAVFLDRGVPYVLSNGCPHAAAPMSEGWVQDGCAVCPRHGWRFDLTDGRLHGSGAEGLIAYKTRTVEYEGRTLVQAELRMP